MDVKLSIITICLNNKIGLQRTIKSLKFQTFKDYEFIVVDGGSTDGTVAVIEENADYIAYYVSEKDNGIYHAMNKGINKAKGKYCLFLNSGDYLYSNNVLKLVFEIENNEDILYGKIVRKKSHYRKVINYSSNLTLFDFYKSTPAVHHQAAFIKRLLFQINGGYREDLKIIGDWEFFFRSIILNKAKTSYIDEIISVFDDTGFSSSKSMSNPLMQIEVQEKLLILRSYFPEFILRDYSNFYQLIEKRTLLTKVVNKICCYSFIK